MKVVNESRVKEPNDRRKRSTSHSRRREARTPDAIKLPALAGFRCVEPGPAAVRMWPVESAAWLSPEFSIALSGPADLRIERRSGIAPPAFASLNVSPSQGRAVLDTISGPEPVALAVVLPVGDLRPFGWDPRAIAKSGEGI